MKLTSANKSAPDGLQYRAEFPGEASIRWTRSPSGATHTGTAGDQTFVITPDGLGTWTLTEIDADGVGHLLEHSLPSDWSAMAAALDYVDAPMHWPIVGLATAALFVIVVVADYVSATL